MDKQLSEIQKYFELLPDGGERKLVFQNISETKTSGVTENINFFCQNLSLFYNPISVSHMSGVNPVEFLEFEEMMFIMGNENSFDQKKNLAEKVKLRRYSEVEDGMKSLFHDIMNPEDQKAEIKLIEDNIAREIREYTLKIIAGYDVDVVNSLENEINDGSYSEIEFDLFETNTQPATETKQELDEAYIKPATLNVSQKMRPRYTHPKPLPKQPIKHIRLQQNPNSIDNTKIIEAIKEQYSKNKEFIDKQINEKCYITPIINKFLEHELIKTFEIREYTYNTDSIKEIVTESLKHITGKENIDEYINCKFARTMTYDIRKILIMITESYKRSTKDQKCDSKPNINEIIDAIVCIYKSNTDEIYKTDRAGNLSGVPWKDIIQQYVELKFNQKQTETIIDGVFKSIKINLQPLKKQLDDIYNSYFSKTNLEIEMRQIVQIIKELLQKERQNKKMRGYPIQVSASLRPSSAASL